MTHLHTPIDSLSTTEQKLNYLGEHISVICDNTDIWSMSTGWVTLLTTLASLVTIIGIVTIIFIIRQRNTSKEWQRKIALDLIRHFMINNAIIEVIRVKMDGQPDTFHPLEGVLTRFRTLESDTELSRFSVDENNYEKIHDLSLKIRNYNTVAMIADRHFCDPAYPRDAKMEELTAMVKRSYDISHRLMTFCKALDKEITREVLHKYIAEDRYGSETVKKWKQNGEYCDTFAISARDDSRERAFYDTELGLTETFDHLIRNQAAVIPFIDY